MSYPLIAPLRNRFALSVALALLTAIFAVSSVAYAQSSPPSYPGITAVKPLFDLPLIASTAWPNQQLNVSGTCQAPIIPVRNCTYFKLVYANSDHGESLSSVPNAISIRASLVVIRPGKPTSIRQVTFNGGNIQVTLAPQTAIVSDKIPEYWDVTENAKAYVRTFVQIPTPTGKVPCYSDIFPLTVERAKWVSSTSNPQDLTLAPYPEPAFTAAAANLAPLYPVAIIGDADPTLPSIAIAGSSSTAYMNGFVEVALQGMNIPYVILGTAGWVAWKYERVNLRARMDASCTHIIDQFGRNDIGTDPNTALGEAYYLDPIKTAITHTWQRQKMQGAWVAQVTLQPRVNNPGNYSDPSAQVPTGAEQFLRLPLNDWIRLQPSVANTPLDYVYEMGDNLEYFVNGNHTNTWNYVLSANNTRVPLTVDGLHLSTAGVNLLLPIFNAGQFAYNPDDWVAPCLASAIIPKYGGSVVVTFNEAKSPPLLGIYPASGLSIQVNGASRTLYRLEQTGPKEATLWVSGNPLRAGDVVTLDYAPNAASPIRDSSPRANPLAAFAAQPVWNNSAVTGSETAPQIAISAISVQRVSGKLVITATLSNKGGTQASVFEITAATLNNVATSTPLPLRVGDIPPQGALNATILFPDLPSGSRALLRLSGRHTQGTSAISVAVTVP